MKTRSFLNNFLEILPPKRIAFLNLGLSIFYMFGYLMFRDMVIQNAYESTFNYTQDLQTSITTFQSIDKENEKMRKMYPTDSRLTYNPAEVFLLKWSYISFLIVPILALCTSTTSLIQLLFFSKSKFVLYKMNLIFLCIYQLIFINTALTIIYALSIPWVL